MLKDTLTELDKAIIRLVEAWDEPTWVLQEALGLALKKGIGVEAEDAETIARLTVLQVKLRLAGN